MKINVDPRAKALIFDVDGTLADTMPIHYLAWQKVGELKGFYFPENLFYELAGVPTPEIAKVVNKREQNRYDHLELAKIKEEIYVEHLHLAKPVVPVVEIVKEYRGKMPLGAGTGSPGDNARLTIKAVDLEGFFDAIVTYEDVENPKPAPDTFLKCAELLNIDPEFCQVFEDGEPGLQAAKKAGMIVTDIRPFLKMN